MSTFIGTDGADEIWGSDDNDLIDGGAGNDSLNGGDGDDSLVGGAGDDWLVGWMGDDTLAGGGGDDDIWGVEGSDTVQYSGNIADYSITYNSALDRLTIVDSVAARDGTDRVSLVDYLQFADQRVFASTYLPLIGTQENDTLVGSVVFDLIFGLDGNDLLDGGAGNDTLYGGDGNDNLIGNAGDDWLDGWFGDDTLVGGGGNDDIEGTDGSDTAQYSGDYADYCITYSNVFHGLTIVDSVAGRDDADQVRNIDYLQFADQTIAATIYPIGTRENDTLVGSVASDAIFGFEGNDLIDGGAGNDSLYGGKGDDTLIGGAGNDVIKSDDNVLSLPGSSAGSNTAQFSGNFADYAISYSIQSNGWAYFSALTITDSVIGRDGTDQASQIDYLQFADQRVSASAYLPPIGTSGDDTLVGAATSEVIYGYDGNDLIQGGAGNDVLGGFQGNDTIYGGDGDDYIFGGVQKYNSGFDGNDAIFGGAGDDVIYAGRYDDIVDGGDGIDTLSYEYGAVYGRGIRIDLGVTKPQVNIFISGADKIIGIENLRGTNDFGDVFIGDKHSNGLYGLGGNDTLDGGAGADHLYGGKGNDVYYVDNVGDQVIEDTGDEYADNFDTVNSSVNWTLGLNLEALNLTGSRAINGFGNELNNVLTGNGAANSLVGNAGDDTLTGGAGADTLTGGDGMDLFVFGTSLGKKNVDTIADFSAGDDLIQLAHTVFSALTAGDLLDVAFQSANVSTALSADVRIIFNTANGALLYDADGEGGATAMQFATISLAGLSGNLSADDFDIT
jgi:serralysin